MKATLITASSVGKASCPGFPASPGRDPSRRPGPLVPALCSVPGDNPGPRQAPSSSRARQQHRWAAVPGAWGTGQATGLHTREAAGPGASIGATARELGKGLPGGRSREGRR